MYYLVICGRIGPDEEKLLKWHVVAALRPSVGADAEVNRATAANRTRMSEQTAADIVALQTQAHCRHRWHRVLLERQRCSPSIHATVGAAVASAGRSDTCRGGAMNTLLIILEISCGAC